MKKYLILITFISVFSVSSQEKRENVILFYNETDINVKQKYNLFKIKNEDFRYLKNKHIKKNILFDSIKNDLISIDSLKAKTKKILKKNKIQDNFTQSYFHKYFDVYIYVQNKKCQNEGVLYEVEWVLSIVKPEID